MRKPWGGCLCLKGEPDNAIKDCTEAVRLNPKCSSAYNPILFISLVASWLDGASIGR